MGLRREREVGWCNSGFSIDPTKEPFYSKGLGMSSCGSLGFWVGVLV